MEEKKVQRNTPPRRKKIERYTITINHPETKEQININIPSYKGCKKSRKKKRKNIYCGDKNPIPQNYQRKGTSYECLKKGYGAGICGIFNYD